MVGNLIERYKNKRKQAFLDTYASYQGKYAFVGIGNHSASNLYPVLDYLGVPLKYVCTKSLSNAQKLAVKYPGVEGTNDLDKVLSDPEVSGVFVCTSPASHFALAKKVLCSGKHLFVEKPPCLSLKELTELQKLQKPEQVVTVGLQKRYSTVVNKLRLEVKGAQSYGYKFLTGAYPEGNPWWDLYIHPLDVAFYLFGAVTSHQLTTSSNGLTHFLQLVHKNGVVGSLELSTDYSWNTSREEITLNTSKGVFTSTGINDLRMTSKSKKILGIPLEKVTGAPPQVTILFDNKGFVPLAEYNELFTHGYYGEIQAFIQTVEGQKTDVVRTSLMDVAPTFELLDALA